MITFSMSRPITSFDNMPNDLDPPDHLATPAEADREYATNVGRARPDVAWILSDRDVWYANPFYTGPRVPHPEDDDANDPHELNMDAADREIARRAAEGEDMSHATIDPVTYAILKPAPAPVMHRQKCPKCRGSGRYTAPSSRGRDCFRCGGAGFLEFKTSEADRSHARDLAAARKVNKADADWATFTEALPELAAWIMARRETFDFARSMHEAVRKYGDLTERQADAVRRCIASDANREVERAARAHEAAVRELSAPVVDTSALERAFTKAMSTGLRTPKISLGSLTFVPAKASSKNAGAIYVKRGRGFEDPYLGKIVDGKFVRARDCTEDEASKIAEMVSDPMKTAESYGLRSGNCCLCNRPLTNKESLARGIGPICAEKFGW